MVHENKPEVKSCWRCGASFECRAKMGGCWCAGFPPVGHLFPGCDCLCPACLKSEAQKIKPSIPPKG